MPASDQEKIKEIKAIYVNFRRKIDQIKKNQNTTIQRAMERIDREHARQILNTIQKN